MSADRIRVVAPDDFPSTVAGHPALARLDGIAEVAVYQERAASVDELVARMAGAEVMFNIRTFTRIDGALLALLPELRLITVMGTGVDNIDLAAATRAGVLVCNAPGANARSVAEHTFALMLAVARHIPRGDLDVRAGRWVHYETPELEGKTLGVLGLGGIGGRVARMGVGFGMRVIAWSRTPDAERAAACGATLVDRESLLREADALCVCLASTAETRGFIGARELALM